MELQQERNRKRMKHILSQDLITEILLRLPVKDLLRFKCVSKPFLALIESPCFVKLHINKSIKTKTHLSLLHFTKRMSNLSIYALSFDAGLCKTFKLQTPFPSMTAQTKVRGSCNGLILFSNSNSGLILLWNPFTRRHKRLSPCPIETKPFRVDVLGLGYDSSSDDYKVLTISKISNKKGDVISCAQVWVFTLRSGSWKRLEDFPLPPRTRKFRCRLNYPGRFANSALHFKCGLKSEDRIWHKRILAWDVVEEIFYEVHRPRRVSMKGLEVLNGCLCMTSNSPGPAKHELYIGERQEVGGVVAWSQLYSLQQEDDIDIPDLKLLRPLTWFKEGNDISRILLVDDHSKVMWYDLTEKKMQIVDIQDLPYGSYTSVVCRESLVSLGNDAEIDGANAMEELIETRIGSVSSRRTYPGRIPPPPTPRASSPHHQTFPGPFLFSFLSFSPSCFPHHNPHWFSHHCCRLTHHRLRLRLKHRLTTQVLTSSSLRMPSAAAYSFCYWWCCVFWGSNLLLLLLLVLCFSQ